MLLLLVQQRFGADVTSQVEQRIATASIDQLEAWSLRVMPAATLSELFNG
jgi:hypothetical protein